MKSYLKLLLLLVLLATQGLSAHPMDEWFVNLQVKDGHNLEGVFRVPADQVQALTKDPILFLADSQPIAVEWTDEGLDGDGRSKLKLTGQAGESIRELTIRIPLGLLDENQSLVGFLQIDSQEPSTLLIPSAGEGVFSVASAQRKPPSVEAFVKLGLSHIVEGYDHLLFLFCLLIAGGTFRHFLVVVTAFTLGHSVTLAASVLGYISLPSSLTETIIALSIVLAALMNLWWLDADGDEEASHSLKSRGLLAGGFGLVHGLGFAGILKEIGIEGSGVVAPLFGFNLGVELGQLIIVSLFFPVLMAIRKWSKRVVFLKGCSVLAALIGIYWMLERMGF
ncbi:MAG: HupE/UreJ family protein [Candidatus Eremiobacteraeota bacterium]|nr:HupE/UreJ family protein [Candidatus Eremiobacteraeota bacterium]